MHGEKISDLAHDAKVDKKAFLELKDKVVNITNRVIRKYHGLADSDDLEAMCYISLVNCVRTFDKTKGLFEPHYLQRAYQEVKREVIRSSLIRVPEAIINLSRKMVPAHKEMLAKAIAEDDTEQIEFIAAVYGTTVRQVVKVNQVKSVVSELGTFVIDTEDVSENYREKEVERSLIIDKILAELSELDELVVRVVLLNTGLLSDSPLPFTKIAEILNISVESVRKLYKSGIEYLGSDKVKERLKGLI